MEPYDEQYYEKKRLDPLSPYGKEDRVYEIEHGNGWDAYVLATAQESPPVFSLASLLFTESGGASGIWGVPQSVIEQGYTDGWNAAIKAEQEQGRAVFLLNELLKMMDAGDEWYGSEFEKPMAMVRKVLAEIRNKQSLPD